MERISWTNDTRKLGELIPWERNPRQINEEEAERLEESLDEFGQPQVMCIEPDNTLVDGHQRRAVWAAAHKYGPDYEVAVRVASRKLTEREKQKLSIYLHRGAHGEWDFDELANWGIEEDLLDWGFDKWELGMGAEADDLRVDMEGFYELDEPDIMYRIIIDSLSLKQAEELSSEVSDQTHQEVRIEQYRV